MDLTRPLYYALQYTSSILGTPVPDALLSESTIGRPEGVTMSVMDGLFRRALRPDHPSCADYLTGSANWLLYVRSHYLRMPLYLLVPHLLRKSIRTKTVGRQPAARLVANK
jgi:hypothetical protein